MRNANQRWLCGRRQYLRFGAVEPKFTFPERPSKLDRFADKLTHWLKVETGKSRKQKRTVKQLHADLVVLGYEGCCTRCRYAFHF